MTVRNLPVRLLTVCVIGSLTVIFTACGGTGSGPTSTSQTDAGKTTHSETGSTAQSPAPLASRSDSDNDADGGGKERHDSDDRVVLDFGHPASASEREQIVALVRRYYAAAASEDGARACSMLYSTFEEAVPEDYGISPPGPAYARGTTCPMVMTLIFKHFHNEIVARLPKLDVSRVGVKERQGLVVLSFGSAPEREIHVSREGHTWKVFALLDNELH